MRKSLRFKNYLYKCFTKFIFLKHFIVLHWFLKPSHSLAGFLAHHFKIVYHFLGRTYVHKAWNNVVNSASGSRLFFSMLFRSYVLLCTYSHVNMSKLWWVLCCGKGGFVLVLTMKFMVCINSLYKTYLENMLHLSSYATSFPRVVLFAFAWILSEIRVNKYRWEEHDIGYITPSLESKGGVLEESVTETIFHSFLLLPNF